MAVALAQLQADLALLVTAVEALIAEKNAAPADFATEDATVTGLTTAVNAALTTPPAAVAPETVRAIPV